MQETAIFDGESHGFRWRFSQLNQSAVTFHRSADVAVTSPSGRGGRWSEEALGAAAHVDRLCPGQYPGCGRPKRGPTWLGTGRGDRNERWLAGDDGDDDDDDDEYEFKLMNDGSWMTTPGPRNRLLIARFGLLIYLPAGSERKQLYNYLLSFFLTFFCRCNVSYGHLFSVWAVRFLSFALSFFLLFGLLFLCNFRKNGRVSEQVQHRTCTFSRCLVISWHFLLFIWSSFRHFPFFGAWHLRQSLKISHRNMSNPTDT